MLDLCNQCSQLRLLGDRLRPSDQSHLLVLQRPWVLSDPFRRQRLCIPCTQLTRPADQWHPWRLWVPATTLC